MDNQNDKYIKKILLKSTIIFIFEAILILIIFKNDFLKYFLGLSLGMITSVFNLIMLYKNILVAIEKDQKGAKRYLVANYFIRYIITGLILFISGTSPYLNIFTCFLGLLNIKLTLYINNLFKMIRERR